VAIIALAFCFAVAVAGEFWEASHIPHAPINQSASAQHKNEGAGERPKESAEQAIARYNYWLTIFTAVLASATVILGFATIGLYFVSSRQLRHVQKEAKDAEWRRFQDQFAVSEQLSAAVQTAEAAKESAAAAAKQAKAAEDALTLLERPYVFIFGVRGIKYDKLLSDFFVEYTVANYGKMPAIIDGPHIGFDISERAEPPMPPLLHDAHSLMASPILQAGEVRRNIRAYFPAGMVGPDITVKIEEIRAADIDPNEIFSGPEKDEPPATVFPTVNAPDGFDVFFRAVIRYRGPFTKGHETGAVWLYNPGNFEFVVRGGEEHNYVK
jgi:hypothetical protein